MKTEMRAVVDEDGKEVGYEVDGSYRGIITDPETGKKYSVQGNDWSGEKDRFRFAQADSLTITELEADGVTPKKDGMLIQGVHYHEHQIRHGRGIDAWYEDREDHVDVFPDGGKTSHVGYYLSGGFGKFGGSVKGIYSVRNAENAQAEELSEVPKNDKLHGVYKALYQKKYAALVKGLIKASQEIRDEARSKAKTKSAENSKATLKVSDKTQRQA